MATLYGWAISGKPLNMPRPRRRGKNISMIGAICTIGMIALTRVHGSVNSDVFIEWFREEVLPCLDHDDVIVLDNASIHRSKAFKSFCEKEKIRVIFLPPYSPEFNPIEFAWSKIKAIISSLAPGNHTDLAEAVDKALSELTPGDAVAWFRHAGYQAAS